MEPVDRLVDGLAQLSFEVMARLTSVAASEQMSLTQLRMLAVLRDRQPRMAELADALGLDRSSVTGLIARAEQRGLVTRRAAEGDGRGVLVQLTDDGQAFTAVVTAKVAARLSDLIDGLDARSQERLSSTIATMLTSR